MNFENIRKLLSEYSAPIELKPKDRERTWKFLKAIGSQGTWIRNILRQEGLRSNRYTLATKEWLLKNRFIHEKSDGRRKILKLTDKGADALIGLDTYYSAPPEAYLEFVIDIGDENSRASVRVESSGKKLNPAEKIKTLVIPRLRDLLIGFITHLTILLSNEPPDVLSIKLEAKHATRDFYLPLVAFWVRYREITQGISLHLFSLLDADFRPPSDAELERYRSYWRKVEHETRMKLERGEELDFSEFLGRDLNWFIVEDEGNEKLARWIDKKLDEDPDWFMPHLLWVQLGFRQRRSLSLPSSANAPSVTFMANRVYVLAEELIKLLSRAYCIKAGSEHPLIEEAVRQHIGEKLGKTLQGAQKAYAFLSEWMARRQNEPDLYEAWRCTRQQMRDVFPEVSAILDAALLRYIFASNRPKVDLASLFKDLALGNITSAHEAVEKIGKGKYGIYR